MLPGTLGRQLTDSEMRIDLQQLADRAGARLVLAHTCGIDLQRGELHLTDHDPIAFDAISIGVGSVPAGGAQHADSPLMVPIKPMQTFLRRLDERLASVWPASTTPMRVSIVGGGAAGIEIAFGLLARLNHGATPHTATIDLFTSSERIAPGMRKRSIHRLEQLLAQRGISVHTGHRVVQVTENEIVLEHGQRYRSDCVIWATGAAPPPLIQQLGLTTDERGFIAITDTLQSLSDPRVFAVGDCATGLITPFPKAGVYAVRQCPILRSNLRSLITGGSMKHFKPQQDFLKLLNTGDGKALLEYGCFTVHARWCWKLKAWIDKRFIREFQVA